MQPQWLCLVPELSRIVSSALWHCPQCVAFSHSCFPLPLLVLMNPSVLIKMIHPYTESRPCGLVWDSGGARINLTKQHHRDIEMPYLQIPHSCVYVCVCVSYPHLCVWWPLEDIGCLAVSLLVLFPWERISHWAWSNTFQARLACQWATTTHQGSDHLCPSFLGLQTQAAIPNFNMGARTSNEFIVLVQQEVSPAEPSL